MLSIYTLKSALDASKYYQKDNYYTKEGEQPYSAWYGKGAEILELKGEVDAAQFKKILEGILPNGIEMLQKQNGGHHRPGYDFTFSAPKSVSILGVIGQDERVMQAHRKAVTKVLNHIENKYGALRNKKNSLIQIEKTDNLTFATFEHTDSRALDPNLHTHCVLMNLTQRSDGEWRTIYADELYKDKLLNGMEYRAVLAKELMALGFEVVQTSEKGTFELANFDDQLVKQFSKRRQQIEEKLNEMGKSGGKAAKTANFLTRNEKIHIDPEHIQLRWEHELKACDSSMDWLQNYSKEAKNRGPIIPSVPILHAAEVVDSAIRHLSERKTLFSTKEILKTALGMSLINCDRAELMKVISCRIEEGQLLHLGDSLLTTQAARDAEFRLAALMHQDKAQVKSMSNKLHAGLTARLNLKSKSQREVLKHILTSPDRQIALQTTLNDDYYKILKVINKVCKDNYYYPIGITQSQAQKEQLKAQTGIFRTYTISSFLESCSRRIEKAHGNPANAKKQYQARQLWIVDPTTKMNINQALQLQEMSLHLGARILWTGKASKSNPILSILLSEQEKKISVEDTQLKKNEMIDLIQTLNQQQTIGLIDSSIEYKERIDRAAEKYVLLPSNNSSLLVTTHADRVAMNCAVREKLIAKGELGKEVVQVQSLQPLSFTDEQKRLIHLYQPDNIVHFRSEYKKINVMSDSYYIVQAIDFKNQTIKLEGNDGEIIEWDPSKTRTKNVNVYRAESRDLRVGDQIVWTKTVRDKNDEAFDRHSGHKAKVIAIEDNAISLSLQNGKTFDFNRFDLTQLHFDHSYAVLITNSNHFKKDNNVLLLTSHQVPMIDSEALASFIKQSKQFNIVCDDIKAIQDKLLIQDHEPHLATQREIVAYDEKKELISNASIIKESRPFARLRNTVEEVIVKNQLSDNVELSYNFEMSSSMTLNQKIAYDAVDYVCDRLVERNAVFSLDDAKKEAYHLVGLKVPKELIEDGFRIAAEKGLLVKVNEETVTTQGIVMMEKACLELVKVAQDTIKPILPLDHLSLKGIEVNEHLTAGQKEAIMLSLTTSDRIIGIQGVPGAGKTTMLKEVNRLCNDAGFRVMGLANTAGAKNRIEEATNTLHEAGITAMTTRKFINHAEKLLAREPEMAKSMYGPNQILVLDEVSMVSTRDLFSLLSLTQRLEARLLLMGDVKQLGAIEAGNPWHLLLGSSMKSVSMKENVRFKDPHTVAIMKDLYAARIDDAFEKLSLNAIEVPDRDERFSAIANLYVNLTKEEQGKTLVVSPKNDDRVVINDKIRELLIKNGTLQGKESNTNILLPKDMTNTEKNSFYSYEVGDFIRFNFKSHRLGIEAGDYLEIVKSDPNTQLLSLKDAEGRHIHWSPRDQPKWSGAIEIFQQESRQLMMGDKIRWRKNDETRGIINGEVAEVIKIEGTTSQLHLRNGEKVDINLNTHQNQHWDHAYSSTVFVAQGQDVSYTIGLCQGPKPYHDKSGEAYYPSIKDRKAHELPLSTTLSSFLVMATRGDEFVMFVDNIDSFKGTLAAQSGLKETAMQHLDPEWYEMAKKVNEMTSNVTGKALPKSEAKLNTSLHQSIPQQKNVSAKAEYKNHSFLNKEEVINSLHSNILGNVTSWRGQPSYVTQREARWGKKGSFSVILSGQAAGSWSDFERGAFGRNLLSLYMETFNVGFKETLTQLSNENGLSNEKLKADPNRNRTSVALMNDKTNEEHNQNKIKFARQIYERGVQIKGTLAEKYLREYRGISGDLPNDFRFCSALKHPHTKLFTPALIVPIRDKDNALQGVVRIFLNTDGSKLNAAIKDLAGNEIKAASKANLGVTKGGAVTVQQGTLPHTLWVAEGVETALSVAKARAQETVLASLSVSQLKWIPVGENIQRIVICADNDGEHSHTRKAIMQAVEYHLSNGHRVFITMPPGNEKCDFNDLLKREGAQAVGRVLEQKVEIKDNKHFDQALSQIRNSPHQSINTLNDQKSPIVVKGETKELLQ